MFRDWNKFFFFFPEIRSSGSMCSLRKTSNSCRLWRPNRRGRYTSTHTHARTQTLTQTLTKTQMQCKHLRSRFLSCLCQTVFSWTSQKRKRKNRVQLENNPPESLCGLKVNRVIVMLESRNLSEAWLVFCASHFKAEKIQSVTFPHILCYLLNVLPRHEFTGI